MKDHDGCRRAFVWSSRAWYAGSIENRAEHEIMFGMYHPDGGSSGEMAMRWIELGGRQIPQLQIFDDAWSALALFTDLIQELGKVDDENITPERFIEMLSSCGFMDDTKYDSPYEPTETLIRKQLTAAKQTVKNLESQLQKETEK